MEFDPIAVSFPSCPTKQKKGVTLVNSSSRRIGWVIKTANMKRLGVDPGCGVLDPKEAILIAVSCDAFAFGQEDTNNDRITVEWTNTPDGAAKQFRREWFQGGGMVRKKLIAVQYCPRQAEEKAQKTFFETVSAPAVVRERQRPLNWKAGCKPAKLHPVGASTVGTPTDIDPGCGVLDPKEVEPEEEEEPQEVAQSVPPGDITTQPRSKIVFNAPYDDKHTYHIKIINSSARRIGWGIRTTNNRRLSVKPSCGVLDPKEAILMAVSCNAFAFGQEDTNNDRITIEWTNTPDGAASKMFRREWLQGNGMIRRKNLPIEYNS